MNCPANPIDVQAGSNDDPSRLIFLENVGPGAVNLAGVSINDPTEVYVHARRVAGGGTQSVSSGTTLIFNSVQSNGDRRAALDDATGVVTVPKGGMYRLRAHLTFTVTDSTVAGSYVQFKIDGGAGPEAFVGALYSTTLLTFLVDRDLYLNAGQTIELAATVNGTSPVFGHASFDSWFSLEKIA